MNLVNEVLNALNKTLLLETSINRSETLTQFSVDSVIDSVTQSLVNR